MLESIRLCQTNGHVFRELEAEKEDIRDTVTLLICRIFLELPLPIQFVLFLGGEREKCDLRNKQVI